MTSKARIRIVKLPLQNKAYDRPQTFPKFPVTLYLELLENKDKVRSELVNVPYNQPSSLDKNLESRLNDILEKSPSSVASKSKDEEDYIPESKEEHSDEVSESDKLANRLNELLDDNNSVISTSSPSGALHRDKYSRSLRRESRNRSVAASPFKNNINYPPTLKELEANGGYKRSDMPNVAHVGVMDQQEEDMKRELLYKIRLLKRKYPGGNVSSVDEFTIHSDLDYMQKEYDSTVKNLTLDSNVENWKTWLSYGFVGTEFLLGKFLNLDMEGFASQQMVNINKYDKLLIEIGEKNYVQGPSKLPVELRLVIMIVTQAAFFLITKMLMKKTGADLLGMFNNASSSQDTGNEKKRKMKGPSIDIENLP